MRTTTSIALASLVLGTSLLGCADKTFVDDEPYRDPDAPTIQVTSPARGAVVGGVQQVTVEGVVTDEDAVASVTVNGIAADIASDGTFRASVDVYPGTNLITTEARDEAGNVGTDTRSALAGTLSPIAQPLEDSVAVALSAQTFDAIGKATAAFAEDGDLTALAAGNVFDVGGRDCLYTYGDLTYLDVGGADVSLTPRTGGLSVYAVLNDVSISVRAYYGFACVDSYTDITAHVDQITIEGNLAVGVDAGEFDVTLQNPNVDIANLQVSATGLPGVLLDAVDFFASIEGLMASSAEKTLAPAVSGALGGLSETKTVDILGKTVSFQLLPSVVDFDPYGAKVQLDTIIDVAGSESGPGFVYTQNQLPQLDENMGFHLALADDVVNQLFAGFWAAGGLTQTIDLTTGDYGMVGQLYDTVKLEALLPPGVNAHGQDGLEIVIGDLIASFELDGEVVTRMAVNGKVAVTAETSGNALRLQVGEPTVEVDIIDEGVVGTNALSGDQMEALISFAATRLAGASGSLLGAVPLPTVGGVGFANLDVGSLNGYLMVEGALTE